MAASKLDTMIAQMSPAQRKAATALLAAMQAPAAPAPATKPKRAKRLGKEHIVRRMAEAKVKTPRVYPYALPLSEQEVEAKVTPKAYQSPTLLEVEGAVKVVLTSMGTLYWYDAKGVELANQVLPPAEAKGLRAQYAHATSLPVWAK